MLCRPERQMSIAYPALRHTETMMTEGMASRELLNHFSLGRPKAAH